MLNTNFTVDMSVWQDGVTFKSAYASQPAEMFEAKQLLQNKQNIGQISQKTTPIQTNKAPVVNAKMPVPTMLTAQQKDVQELPASLANVTDLTPFIVGAKDSKPGARLNDQLARTEFTKQPRKLFSKNESPYNMSEEKAIAREKAREMAQKKAKRPLKGVGDAKVFPMSTASRFNQRQDFSVGQSIEPSALEQAKKMRIEQMTQQSKRAEGVSVASNAKAAPVDIEAIKSQVSGGGYGYQRTNLPSGSSESLSPATSWFPEAMTRQLDAYEAASKAAEQYGVGANGQQRQADYNV